MRISIQTTVCGALCLCGGALWACEGSGAPGAGPGDSVFEMFSPPEPAQIVAWAADPNDASVRQRGILLLANAPYGGEPEFVRLYEQAVTDGDAAVRSAAVRALSINGDVDHATMLAPFLRDKSALVRREAARALQRLHNEEAVEPLLGAVDARFETDADVRQRAAAALGQYAQPRVVQALIGALQDRMLRVNLAAEASLQTLTGQDQGSDPGTWIRWANSSDDLFAGRREYVYPVFHRDPTLVEKILPWRSAPNENPATPIGMPPVGRG